MVSRVIPVEAFDLVIFGGTGDLARRKVLPGLFRRFCAGQMPFAPLLDKLEDAGVQVSCIGGASNARGLDAQRAIREGLKLATKLESDLVSE